MIPAAHLYFRYGTQTRKLYDRLVCGPATSRQIVRSLHITQYEEEISAIRKALICTNITVKARAINGRRNLWEYRLGVREEPEKTAH